MDSSITQSAAKRISMIQSHLIPEETSANSQPKRNVNICPATGFDKNKVWPRLLEQDKPIRVLVTGAAGNIAYSLLFMIANGGLFGSRQPIVLHLLDIPAAADALKGVHMELVDGSFPILRDVVATTDVRTAFSGVEVAILVGAFPRQKGMERKDLLKKNCAIFKEQGKALNDYASKDVKVVVVGNPANTNCAIAQANAPDLPAQNFTALTRLDHNRAKAQVALKLRVPVKHVKNVIIWGNHSATQFPDVNFGVIEDFPTKGFQSNIRTLINDDKWIHNEFLTTVQQRGAAIIQARKLSSAASAAHAVTGHLRDWLFGTVQGEFVSMAVVSDGSYGVPKDIVFSYPVTCAQGQWNIVQSLPWDDFSKKKIDATTTELLEEKTEAFSFLG